MAYSDEMIGFYIRRTYEDGTAIMVPVPQRTRAKKKHAAKAFHRIRGYRKG